MANLSKQKRDRMLAFLEELKKTHDDDASIQAFNEIENHIREKKYGLVWEEHSEKVDELLKNNIPILCEDKDRRLCKDKNLPWNYIIEGDNLQALYLLEKTHRGNVDCIYIDPPYNTGAKDWKYNNDYVDGNDVYRHSKWLSMMKSRLLVAKRLLNPSTGVLILTIDEHEVHHIRCLLEEVFAGFYIQMVTCVTNPTGATQGRFSRIEEYAIYCFAPNAYVCSFDDPMIGENTTTQEVRWKSLLRSGTSARREDRKNMFYPVYIDTKKGVVIRAGNPLPYEESPSFETVDGMEVAWPIRTDNSLGRWSVGAETLNVLIQKGYVMLGKYDSKRKTYGITYISAETQKMIESGEIIIVGKDDKGVVKIEYAKEHSQAVRTVWYRTRHNAGVYGTNILSAILGKDRKFPFPKSVYVTKDSIATIMRDRKNALIVDFFAGSGTTLHAVNILNAEDDGNRRCVIVTNNEVSVEEVKKLKQQGFKQGDPEWEALGIAQYVTWPRSVCSIEGKDINGKDLKGEYITTTDKTIKMSDGFKANVKYFKCNWTPRKPEDYLLSNALCLHIKEMIELQTAQEVDGEKNVLILNKDDFNKYINDKNIYEKIENIWVNQNMILSPEEMKLLKEKGFKYIPKEYFGQELKEAAE